MNRLLSSFCIFISFLTYAQDSLSMFVQNGANGNLDPGKCVQPGIRSISSNHYSIQPNGKRNTCCEFVLDSLTEFNERGMPTGIYSNHHDSINEPGHYQYSLLFRYDDNDILIQQILIGGSGYYWNYLMFYDKNYITIKRYGKTYQGDELVTTETFSFRKNKLMVYKKKGANDSLIESASFSYSPARIASYRTSYWTHSRSNRTTIDTFFVDRISGNQIKYHYAMEDNGHQWSVETTTGDSLVRDSKGQIICSYKRNAWGLLWKDAFVYDENNNLVVHWKIKNPLITNADTMWKRTFFYDSTGHMEVEMTFDNGMLIDSTHCAYDQSGELIRKAFTEFIKGVKSETMVTEYQYSYYDPSELIPKKKRKHS